MEIEETFKLLDEGKTEIVLDNAHRDNVIMLGNTGSGKSTLTLFIAADNNKLIAEETSPGSGDYTINDNDLIGNITAESQTLFPNLIVDPQTNVGYYDCPGFLDTRNSSYDIASTYFTKEVIDFSQTVKLTFVVNYSAVKIGNDRQDFPTLVRHIVTLVKDAAKFSAGISLIATKVENKYVKNPETGKLELVPDNIVVNTIGDYLLEFKRSLQNGKVYPGNTQLQQKALILLEVFLTKTNDVYSRIGIFRQPDRPGPVANIPFLQENRKKLIQLLSDNIEFVAKGEDDFGYTISDKTQVAVHDLVQEINRRIANASVEIGNGIEDFCKNQISLNDNIYRLETFLQSGYNVWSPFIDQADKITSPEEYYSKVVDNTHKSNMPISEQTLEYLADQSSYFNFFEQVSGNKQEILPLSWVEGIKPSVTFAQRSMNWYQFLINLFDKLSTFNFQRDPTLYNVADPNNWGQSGKPQGIEITNRNAKTFLEKLSNEHIDGYNNVKSLTDFSEFELRDLNKILDVTLIQRPSYDCKTGDKLIVKGNFVKMSYVSQIKCSDVKKIEILALHVFFVDGNLEKSANVQVGAIAPTWEVTKSAKIFLGGQAGASQDKPPKTASPSGKGKDGKPGLAGKTGGTFFGIGKTFVGGNSLMITTEGGAGGGGQAGGDGGDGNRGADPELPPKRKWFNTDLYFYSVGDLKFRYKLTDTKTGMMGSGVFYIDSYYDVYGDHANGGNGGDGGVGGLGGNGGIVTMVELDGACGFGKTTNQGPRGSGGAGGKSGSPGTDGDTLKTVLSQIGSLPPSGWVVKSRQAGAKSSWGSEGTSNKNEDELAQPDQPLNYTDPYDLIVDYKTYLRDHLQNAVQQESLTEFLDELEKNNEIKKLYTTLGLTYEFLSLENQFYTLTRQIDVLPLYKSIKDRISNYAADPIPTEKTLESKKVLNYVYSAALSKICSLINSKDGNLIIDISGYLKLVKVSVSKLKDIGKQAAINQYKEEYSSQIDKKVFEASDFIETKIKPEINNIESQIDSNLDTLIKEVIDLINDTQSTLEALRIKQEELKRAMSLKMALGFVGVFGQALGFLGPWGQAVGGVISITSSVAGSFVLDEAGNIPSKTLPDGVTTLVSGSKELLETRNKEKLEAIKGELDKLKEQIKQYPDQLNDLKPKLDDLANQAANIRPGTDTAELENSVSKELQDKKTKLENDQTSAKEKVEGSLKILKGIETSMKVLTTTVDVFNKYKKDQVALDQIAQAIEKQEEQMKQLMQYQKDIDNIIIPLVDGVYNDINDVEKHLEGKTPVALDVTKWEIQSSIRDMKSLLQQFTKGYKVEENLSRSIEKLDEAMGTLINVYDRIQNYQDQQQLAVYIADISSTPALNINIKNPKLKKAIDDLDYVIESGIVYAQYKRAVNAFQQWVFPFADFYFDDFELPANLQVNNSIQDLAFTAGQHIDLLQARLQEYKVSVIKGHDEFLIQTKFYSNYTSTEPFIVWDNNNYKFEISQLLAGKQVTLNASPLKGGDKNSVKFNLAQIHFKVQNETIQRELDSLLNNFQVFMTHMGSSLYRCDQRYFIIISESQLINYSFEKDANGQPLITNKVYDKIKNGDLTLSPYVMWGMQLNKTASMDFDKLSPYKDLIDVELVGVGQYVSQDSDICSHKLTNYYQLERTLSEIKNSGLPRLQIEEANIKRFRREISQNVYSSGSKTSSPINTIFKWFKTAMDNVKNIGGWFNNFQSLNGPESNSNSIVSSYYYDVNSSLVLADLLVRKFTKEKASVPKENSLPFNEAQWLVLEVLDQFEEELKKLGLINEFDPVSVLNELVFAVINENYWKISEVLCKSVKLDSAIEGKLKGRIFEILEKEVGNMKQNSSTCNFNYLHNEFINAEVINENRFSDCIGENSGLFLQ